MSDDLKALLIVCGTLVVGVSLLLLICTEALLRLK
jgi:hypothetical protein